MATSADIRIAGDRAYYRPGTDHIQMPDRDRFIGTETINATESYFATLLHELTHWSGNVSRLDRDLSVDPFRSRERQMRFERDPHVRILAQEPLLEDLHPVRRPPIVDTNQRRLVSLTQDVGNA